MPPLPVITGLGFITSIGHDRISVLRNLRELRHGFEPVEFFDNPNLPVKVAGTVKGFSFPTTNWRDWRWPRQFSVDRELVRGLAPAYAGYAVCALQQALAEAGLDRSHLVDGSTGLFYASAGSPFRCSVKYFQSNARDTRGERGNPMGIVSSVAGTLNFNLAAHLGITGASLWFRLRLRFLQSRSRLCDG